MRDEGWENVDQVVENEETSDGEIELVDENPQNNQDVEGEEDETSYDEVDEEEEQVEFGFCSPIKPVDPSTFDEYPANWNFEERIGHTLNFRRNPLAALHKKSEITSFYEKVSETEDASTDFVLNINYVGNEMHQSSVRVQFPDSNTGLAKKLYDWERDDEGSSTFRVDIDSENHKWIKFLVFYGYLQQEG